MCTNYPDDHKVAVLSTPQSDLMHMHQVATHHASHALQNKMCFVVLSGVSEYSPDCFFWELGCSNYITLPAESSSVFLTEFPGCYSVPIPITLNIKVQGLLSLLASLGDEAKGGECSEPGPQVRHVCIYLITMPLVSIKPVES
jgi:hypothetical protein